MQCIIIFNKYEYILLLFINLPYSICILYYHYITMNCNQENCLRTSPIVGWVAYLFCIVPS